MLLKTLMNDAGATEIIFIAPTFVKRGEANVKTEQEQLIPDKFFCNSVDQVTSERLQINDADVTKIISNFKDLKHVRVSFINDILVLKLYFDCVFTADTSPDILRQHWEHLHKIFLEVEETVFQYHKLDVSSKSKWQSLLYLIELKGDEFENNREEIISFQNKIFIQDEHGDTNTIKSLDNMVLGSSWDYSIAFINPKKVNKAELDFLFLMACIDWQYFDLSKLSLLKLINDIGKNIPEVTNERAQNVISNFYFNKLKIDPYFLSYEEQDIQFISMIQKSWNRDEMASQALQSFNDAKEAFNLLFQREQAKMQKLSVEKQDFLNMIISLVGIISIAGTIATIFAFIDFKNQYFTLVHRIFFVCCSSLSFSLWVLVFLRNLRRNKMNYKSMGGNAR